MAEPVGVEAAEAVAASVGAAFAEGAGSAGAFEVETALPLSVSDGGAETEAATAADGMAAPAGPFSPSQARRPPSARSVPATAR
jgi:hypothetical protein